MAGFCNECKHQGINEPSEERERPRRDETGRDGAAACSGGQDAVMRSRQDRPQCPLTGRKKNGRKTHAEQTAVGEKLNFSDARKYKKKIHKNMEKKRS